MMNQSPSSSSRVNGGSVGGGDQSGGAAFSLMQREVDRLTNELDSYKSENSQLKQQVQYLSHLLFTKRNSSGGSRGPGCGPMSPGGGGGGSLHAPHSLQEGKCVVVNAKTGEVHTDDESGH